MGDTKPIYQPEHRSEAKWSVSATIFIGLGLFAANVLWQIYNAYVPIFLQAGNPAFDPFNTEAIRGFGFGAGLTGLFMTLDNIAAFFIQPVMGPISDKTKMRLGSRLPWIIAFAPVAVLAFLCIPFAAGSIPAEANGMMGSFFGPFGAFLGAIVVMLLAMAIFRTPLFSLMPDCTPSEHRSVANGIINLVGGIGIIVASVVGGLLWKTSPTLPFLVFGPIALAAISLLVLRIREPRGPVESTASEPGLVEIIRSFNELPAHGGKSLLFLLMGIFCYMFGYSAVETFFTSFAVNTLHVKAGVGAMIFAAAGIAFIFAAVPMGMLAERIGRRTAMRIGLIAFATLLALGYAMPSVSLLVAIMALGGVAWAAVNINGLPMVLDIAPSAHLSGTFTGFYFVAATLAQVAGPWVNGMIVEASGSDFRVIFLVCPGFFLFAFAFLSKVKHGEVVRS